MEIKLISLGGQDERGKNIYVLEVDQDLIIFDSGVKFPEKGILGINVVIPNINWLKDNKNRIKAIFLSNPSVSNAGAITHILKDISTNVYCNKLTMEIMNYKISRLKIKNKINLFKELKDKETVKISNNISVEAFSVTSSFPESMGFAVHTPIGTVIYIGDYIVDGNHQNKHFAMDIKHLNKISSENNIIAFISDSEYASRLDYTSPNHRITKHINIPMSEPDKKIIFGLFEEDIFKLYEIAKEAIYNNRKIAIYSDPLNTMLIPKILVETMGLKELQFMTVEEYKKSKNGILVVTAAGNALYVRLSKLANGNEDSISIEEDDIIILATPPSPGVEKKHAQILDELARTNARLISLSDKNLWSMRASYEDIKLMTKILKPKSFIPIKGLYKEFVYAKKAAQEAGVIAENIPTLWNGGIIKIDSKGEITTQNETIESGDVYVDGTGNGDIGSIVLNERKQLATDGVVITGVNIDYQTKEIISLIDMQLRGVIYVKDDNPVFTSIQNIITEVLENARDEYKKAPSNFVIQDIKREIIVKLRSTIKKQTGKQPIVLVIVNEINLSNNTNVITKKAIK